MFSNRTYDFFLQCNVFINFPKSPQISPISHQNKQTESYSNSRSHLYREKGSVYLKFEKKSKKIKTINKTVPLQVAIFR